MFLSLGFTPLFLLLCLFSFRFLILLRSLPKPLSPFLREKKAHLFLFDCEEKGETKVREEEEERQMEREEGTEEKEREMEEDRKDRSRRSSEIDKTEKDKNHGCGLPLSLDLNRLIYDFDKYGI